MANILSSLRKPKKRPDERFGLDEYMGMVQYAASAGGLLGYDSARGDRETIENDFCGYVQGAYKTNGIVFACSVARMFAFSEARFIYQRFEKGRPGGLYSLPELSLLEKPNTNISTGELLSRAIQDVDMCGNWYVVRGAGPSLTRLRPDWVDIILTADPAKAVKSDVAGYAYYPGGNRDSEPKIYLPQELAHWSPIPDPEAQYRGMSWITPVLREIIADKAATKHKGKFFDNAATPNLAVSFKETVTKEQFDAFMASMSKAHDGVDNAYKTLYLGGGADVTVVGADMAQMDFKNSQGTGETRIAAAARIHPVIVGLSEGMQGSSLNAGNYQVAKDAFADGTLRPLWRSICAALEHLFTVPTGSRLWYDDRDIPFLRRDQTQRAEIQATQARTISNLIQAGYTHDSIVLALIGEDWSLLEHTGLFSVQLMPPGTEAPTASGTNGGDNAQA